MEQYIIKNVLNENDKIVIEYNLLIRGNGLNIFYNVITKNCSLDIIFRKNNEVLDTITVFDNIPKINNKTIDCKSGKCTISFKINNYIIGSIITINKFDIMASTSQILLNTKKFNMFSLILFYDEYLKYLTFSDCYISEKITNDVINIYLSQYDIPNIIKISNNENFPIISFGIDDDIIRNIRGEKRLIIVIWTEDITHEYINCAKQIKQKKNIRHFTQRDNNILQLKKCGIKCEFINLIEVFSNVIAKYKKNNKHILQDRQEDRQNDNQEDGKINILSANKYNNIYDTILYIDKKSQGIIDYVEHRFPELKITHENTGKNLDLNNINYNVLQDIDKYVIDYNIDVFNNYISKCKNILLISNDYPSYGGAATHCYKLMKYLENNNHKVFVIYFTDEDPHIQTYEKNIKIVNTIRKGHPIIQNLIVKKSLDSIIPIEEIKNYFNDNIDLVILRNAFNVDILKKYFDCPFYFLVPGLFGSKLNVHILSTTELNKYVNPEIINTIQKCDKVFVNGNVTYYLLKKYYNTHANILYFNDMVHDIENTNIYNYTFDRKYILGVIISDFTRPIKNVGDIRTIFSKYPDIPKIAIGKKSNILANIPNTTCIDLVDNKKINDYMKNIKIILNTSFYEGCSNVLLEAITNGCEIQKYAYLEKQFDYDSYNNINSFITDLDNKLNYKQQVFSLHNETIGLVNKLCIMSYINNSYNFILYSYCINNLGDVPNKCVVIDASTILPHDEYIKCPEIFKYIVMYKNGWTWTNMNIVNMRKDNRKYIIDFPHVIKLPKGSNVTKLCIDKIENSGQEEQIFQECIIQFNLKKFDTKKKYILDNVNSETTRNISNEIIYANLNKIQENIVIYGSLYLRLLSKYIYKFSIFCCATEPIANGYPIYESIKSFEKISDEIIIIYGRPEEESEKYLLNLSSKIKIINTNKWNIDWEYGVMTEHFDMGLKSCTGHMALKIDIDYISRCDDLCNHDDFREKIFSFINKYHVIQLPRINYLAGEYFCFCKNMGPYVINKHLLSNNKKYCIGVKGYTNTICIDGKYNEVIINDYNYGIFNYDCTFMTKDQYIEKQKKWFGAYYKTFGNLDRFDITVDNINDEIKVLDFCYDRLFIKRTTEYRNMGIQYNPKIIRNKIENLTDDQFGKYYFDIEKYNKIIETYDQN